MAKKKNGKGIGAIIVAVLAVIVAVVMMSGASSVMSKMKERLLEEAAKGNGKFATISKYAEKADTNTGLVGFVSSMFGNVPEEDKEAFEAEAKSLVDLLKEEKPAEEKPADEKPAEEAAPAEAPQG